MSHEGTGPAGLPGLAGRVVEPGDAAVARGTLLRLPGGWCLAPDGAHVITEAGAARSASPAVELSGVSPDDGARFGRQQVRVTGVWRGSPSSGRSGNLAARAVQPLGGGLLDLGLEDPLSPLPDRPGRPFVHSAAAQDAFYARLRANPPRRPPAPSGAGLDGAPAAAGPWDAATLRALMDVLSADETLLWQIGQSLDDHGVRRVTATLTHLPRAVAGRLAAFPADALELTLLVEPDAG